jgi:mono/diheme cytochrome c family protein
MDGKRTLVMLFVGIFLLEHAAVYLPNAKSAMMPKREAREVAGHRIALKLGCFSCHGPEGLGGVKNPGSEDGVVPPLTGGEISLWAADDSELRMWIVDGFVSTDGPSQDPRAALTAGLGSERAIVMPAYKDFLTDRQLDDLVAYIESISGVQQPDDPNVVKGMALMEELGCFRCHGPMGTGGVANPQSLKGYVPGFTGEDFLELVRDDDELREWLRDGVSDRFATNPVARAILARQAIKMPAYGTFIGPEDREAIVTAVRWLSSGTWRAQDYRR